MMAGTDAPLVSVETDDGVAVVRRHNPPLHVLTLETTRRLHDVLVGLAADDTVRAVVMSTAGGRSFGAGSDITEFADLIAAGDVVERKMDFENQTFSLLADLPQPTVAAVRGPTLGGGLEIALACDLVVAEEDAVVGFPEVRLGVIPGSGGPVRAARRVGEARLKEMMLLGDPLPAPRALEWGLVNRVVAPGGAEQAALDWARTLAAGSVSGLRACKRAAHEALEVVAGERRIRESLDISRAAFSHPDAAEGAGAFLERREADWPSTRG